MSVEGSQNVNAVLVRWSQRFIKSIWLFPAILTLLLVLLTIFHINGSSIASYKFYFGNTKDRYLIAGQSRAIRSDEWLVNSQLTIAQASNGFARINNNIGEGQDMSLMIDVPVKDWSVLFKPQNLGFFILPFENAYALRWWLLSYLLLVGCYFFVLMLLPDRRLVAALAALSLYFSPFVQWWYTYGTLGSIFWSLFAGIFFIKLLRAPTWRRAVVWGLLLSYVIVGFALVLYPPFQIPCALTMAAFALGYLFVRFRRAPWIYIWQRSAIMASAIAISSLLIVAFIATRQSVFTTVSHTVYPGARNSLSGAYNGMVNPASGMFRFFSAPLDFQLQNQAKGQSYYTNQSEAASFILINIILAPAVLLAIYKKTKRQRTIYDYLFVATSLMLGVYLLRMFTPLFNLPFKFLLLNQVQNERLEIGLGLLCIMQLVLIGGLLKDHLVSKKMALLTAGAGFAFFADASLVMAKKYPLFAPSRLLIIAMTVTVALVIYLVLQAKTYTWGLGLFATIMVVSSIGVNPLYAQSQPDSIKTIINYIDSHYPDHQAWAVMDQLITENIPQMAGKPALTGVNTYPQLDLWRRLDPTGTENFKYNRYAHVIFTTQKFADGSRFSNPQPDVLMVSFNCDMARLLPNFGHILSTPPVDTTAFPCLQKDSQITYAAYTLHIYSYVPTAP